MGKAGHLAARVQVDGNVDVGPDALAHKGGNAVGDAGHGGGGAGAFDKDAVEIKAVVLGACAGAGAKGGHVEHRHQHQPPQHVLAANFAQEVFDGHRPLVFVAVIAAKSHQTFAGFGLRSPHDGEGNEVAAPDAGVAQGGPVVAAAGGFEVDIAGIDDFTRHVYFSLNSRHY